MGNIFDKKNYKKNRARFWVGGAIASLIVANIFAYQNCSKVAVEDTAVPINDVTQADFVQSDGGEVSTTTTLPPKNCDSAGKLNGEKWLVSDGTSRVSENCKIGKGMLFHVMNIQKELICLNGQVSPTGMVSSNDSGIVEGSCDLSCGDYKDGQLFWKEISQNSEEKMCPTSLTVKMSVKYSNEAQYKCTQGSVVATGDTRRTVLNETECPPLAFNDSNQIASIAYEDTYIPTSGTASGSDYDYNDFVGSIKVLETYNSLEQLTKISIEYAAKKKVSGLDSQLVLVFDGQVRGRNNWKSNVAEITSQAMFEGDASIEVKTFKADQLVSTKAAKKNEDLILFGSTTQALSSASKVVVTITGLDGKLNTLALRKGLSIKRYRTLLHVLASNNGYDVDLSDINPLMYDFKGMPLAFFVPIDWRAPKESQTILEPYPKFKDHAAYLSSGKPLADEPVEIKNWFNYLARPDLVY